MKHSKEMHSSSKSDVIEIPVGKFISAMRNNPWRVVSVVLFIALVIVVFYKGDGSVTGNVISGEEAGKKLIDFVNVNNQGQGSATLVSAERKGALYEVTVNFQGQTISVFVTLDGEYLISNPIPLSGKLPEQRARDNVQVDISGSPVLGSVDAKVTMIEFSDYQCPFCKRFYQEVFQKIREKYITTGKVKLVFKDFPLTNIHPEAQKAAEAARCVREQIGDVGYFRMHDVLFERQQELSIANYKKWAVEADVAPQKFNECLDTGKTAEAVSANVAEGKALGITGTPTFITNGKVLEGALQYSAFEQTIEEALKGAV